MHKGQDYRKKGSFRKSKDPSRKKESDVKRSRKSRKNAMKETQRRLRNGSDQRVKLSKERQLAIQALHAALSGQEAKMIAELNSKQQSLNEGESKQIQAQQDEVGYSNYARRGVGKGPLARAGRIALAKGSDTSHPMKESELAGMVTNIKEQFGNEGVRPSSNSLRRSRSETNAHIHMKGPPGIFYDTGTSYA